MVETKNLKWYDNTVIVVVLLIIFFPLGLYALWKNNKIKSNVKIIVTSIIVVGLLILFAFPIDKNYVPRESNVADEPTLEYSIGDIENDIQPHSLYGSANNLGIGVSIVVKDSISKVKAKELVLHVIEVELATIRKSYYDKSGVNEVTFWIFEPNGISGSYIYEYDLIGYKNELRIVQERN